jgi:FkbM family methyltransferase
VSALTSVRRKALELRTWTQSVRTPLDWPAAALLALCRTRPGWARAVRRVTPRIWLRPRMLGGLWLSVDATRLSHFVIYEEVFIDGVYDLGQVAFEPDAIVDCGAFEGYFSLLARARFPTPPIIAFEPDAANYAGLVTNTSAPALRIEARAAAVSTTEGEATFSGSGCGGRLGADASDARSVQVRDLRQVLSELRAERLLLKLDIEGEEARLLPLLLAGLPRRCAMFFEWHQGAKDYGAMAELLAGHGFKTSLVRERSLDGLVFIDAFAQRA